MKIPLSWLREYVDLDNESPREIAERLTFSGTEVEAIETIGSAYEGLVVAEVRAVEKHPNADKLTICRVFDGTREWQVVCGAPNVAQGGRYPFAPLGATLPKGAQTIKKVQLRGVESFGMLCAADELGLSADHSGLLALDPQWAPGTPLSEVLGPPDTVLELEITPNRPDCLSLIGVARELAAIFRRPLRRPNALEEEACRSEENKSLVTVEDVEGCARYTARVLEGVKVGSSPEWMQRRLERAGIRSINNIVDITNYVMLETGHPLHAFDRDLLAGGRVIVRRARHGERVTALDGVERELDPSTLVIADAERPVAIAGVMGGIGSEIRDETTTVLLEAAWFDPNLVRAAARKLGLSTESSYRFERGVDIETVEWASRRAAHLMIELAGARVVGGVIDTRPAGAPCRRISGRFQTVRGVTGMDIDDAAIADIFRRLELGVEIGAGGEFEVVVPSFRGDLEREIDLVEEVARIHGLHHVPAPHPRAVVDPTAGQDHTVRAKARLRSALAGLGISEILNYSLVSDALLDLIDPTDKSRRVPIPRPISADQSVLRTSLVPQMVETLGRNRARQIQAAALYEIGRVFLRNENHTTEEERVCLGFMGPVGRTGLDRRRAVTAEEIFLWAKGAVESLAATMNLGQIHVTPRRVAWAEPGAAVDVEAGDAQLGVLAIVDRRIRKEWRLADPIAVVEMSLTQLTSRAVASKAYREIPAYPSIARDVAMIVSDSVSHADIVRTIRAAAPPELETIELFDIFRGPAIGEGRRSVAYSLVYRSALRTLTDEEANGYHDAVKAALRKNLGAEIREG
jgi:phenylalanyl-tRNA synthetase beta chain